MLEQMSVSDLFDVVSCAKSKLGKAASNSEQNLRMMVLHANLIDGLMGELNDVEDLPNIAPSTISSVVASSDVIEEPIPESDANICNEEMQEFQDFDCEELSLTRWPSHPPTAIRTLHSTSSMLLPRVDDVVPEFRSPLSPLALHSLSERNEDDVKQSMPQSRKRVTDMCEGLRKPDATRSLVATAPKIESSIPKIEIEVVEVQSNERQLYYGSGLMVDPMKRL